MTPNGMTKTTRCVSSDAAATLAEVERLVRDVQDYRGANPGVTLAVSGADSDAVARKLQDASTANVPGDANATLVVARRAGAEVARFCSVTSIVPVVRLPPGPFDSVRVAFLGGSGKARIVRSTLREVHDDVDGTETLSRGVPGKWLSTRAYACFNSPGLASNVWFMAYFYDNQKVKAGVSAAEPTTGDGIKAIFDADPSFAEYDWTGTIPTSSDFPPP